ncbi:MAG TPA: L-histidine N(alpha)-methyltransferase [Marinobacter sp.]|nr:L-histidine N(alpha)-methyltransferase [Marinobacter sp.]
MPTAVQFHDHQPDEISSASMKDDVLRGLRAGQKFISPKYFYDERGSGLFEEICKQPEYYLSRTEESILASAVDEIDALAGADVALIELGSGASRKVRLLLEHMQISHYLGIDISRSFLHDSTHRLARDYPWLRVHAICADFCKPLSLPLTQGHGRPLAFFPGSSIGNFTPAEARRFMARLYQALPPGSGLLIGVDLVKSPDVLEAAYNDAARVTEAFNRNLLYRLVTELDAQLEPERFEHRAVFNQQQSRIEMHLVSSMAQVISVAGESFSLQEGESIHTENSYKYSIDGFQVLAADAGFVSGAVWTDSEQKFSVHFLHRVS